MVPRPTLPLLLILLLSVVPAASACSLAERPPEPGVLSLLDPETGEVRDVAVTGRQLGASCDLSNPFDVEGDRLAYLTRPDQDHHSRLMVHDRSTNQTRHVATLPTFAYQLSIVGDGFLTLDFHSDDGKAVRLYDPTNGTNETLPIDLGDHPQVVLADHLVFTLARSGDGATLSAYDASEGTWLFQDRPLDPSALPDDPHIYAASTEWLLFGPYEPVVYHVGGDEAHRVDVGDGAAFGLDDAHLYYAVRDADGRQVWRVPLPGGSPQPLGEPRYGLLGVAGGFVVTGTYAAEGFQAPDVVGLDRGDGPSSATVPGLAPVALLLVALVGARLRGRRATGRR